MFVVVSNKCGYNPYLVFYSVAEDTDSSTETLHFLRTMVNSLNGMLYWTSWPDNLDAVAVQLDKMIIKHREAGLVSRIMHAT